MDPGSQTARDEAACRACGACCGEAYDSTPVSDEDLIRLAALIREHDDGWRDLHRVPSDVVPLHTDRGSRCIALTGDGSTESPFHCTVYVVRPTNCRELAVGSDGCLTARSRLALPPLTC